MKEKRIEFYVSFLALIIAFIAVLVSMLQLHISREHNKLTVTPKILLTPYLEGKGGRNGIYIENSGLGPGVINSFQVTSPGGVYSGLGTDKWTEIFHKNNIESSCFKHGWPDPDATLKVGESIALIEMSKSAPNECYSIALNLFQRNDILINIGYQSLYNESFSVERNLSINSKKLDEFNSLISRIYKK